MRCNNVELIVNRHESVQSNFYGVNRNTTRMVGIFFIFVHSFLFLFLFFPCFVLFLLFWYNLYILNLLIYPKGGCFIFVFLSFLGFPLSLVVTTRILIVPVRFLWLFFPSSRNIRIRIIKVIEDM